MTTTPNLQALACEDCPAEILLDYHRGMGGRVLVATVRHETTCPWLSRVAPDEATIVTEWGILIHCSNATTNPPEAVGDER